MKTVIAPKQFGNPYFDAMSCPLDILPETFTIQVRHFDDTLEVVELPTIECATQGCFVSRHYTGIQTPLVNKALNKRGIFVKSIIFRFNIDGIDIKMPTYN